MPLYFNVFKFTCSTKFDVFTNIMAIQFCYHYCKLSISHPQRKTKLLLGMVCGSDQCKHSQRKPVKLPFGMVCLSDQCRHFQNEVKLPLGIWYTTVVSVGILKERSSKLPLGMVCVSALCRHSPSHHTQEMCIVAPASR